MQVPRRDQAMRTVGLSLCVGGGLALLAGLIFGIMLLTGHGATGLVNVPVDLQTPGTSQTSVELNVDGDVIVSAWIKVPGRAIETEDISFGIDFVDARGHRAAHIEKVFGFWHTRRGTASGQLYKLGETHFAEGFSGTVSVHRSSDWAPSYDGAIVLRNL